MEVEIWLDDISRVKPQAPWPDEQVTMEILKRDSAMKFIDNINTPQVETINDEVTLALKKATVALSEREKEGRLEWAKYKRPAVYHLLKESLLGFARQDLPVGGAGNIINAVTHSHGPSWRMIVQLTSPTEAYGVYPGGESGNPGSVYYDNYLDNWVNGKYYKLWFMREGDRKDKNIKWVMKFSSK